ncbi:MAG: hypothetical protein WA130_09445 [Candidatus Methanoperedens sp.]
MGRTVPSFSMLLEGIIEELSAFRRALRGEDRNVFDSFMNKARQHASSCTVVPLLDPMDAMFLSISNDGRTGISDGSKEQLPEGLWSNSDPA